MNLIKKIAMFVGWYAILVESTYLMISGFAALLSVSWLFFPIFFLIGAWLLFGALYPLNWVE